MSVEQERIKFISTTMKYLVDTKNMNYCNINDVNYITFSDENIHVHMVLVNNNLMTTVDGNIAVCDVFKRMYNER